MNASPCGASSTVMATFASVSRFKRSRMTRLCSFLPSRPANGLSLMPNVTLMVGGSIGCASKGSVTAGAHSVSDTVALDMPAMATISPGSATSIGCRDRPRKASILLARKFSTNSPVRDIALICVLTGRRPDSTRPVSRRPRNGSASNVVANIRNGASPALTICGAGT